MIFSAPIRDRATGKLMGVVASWVNWGGLFDEGLAKKERFGETGELPFVEARKEKLLAAGRNGLDRIPDPLLRQINVQSHGIAAYGHPTTGRRYLAGWATESGFGAYPGQHVVAVAQQEETEAMASVSMLNQFLGLGLFTALAIVGTAAVLARRFSRPLIEMAQVAERIARATCTRRSWPARTTRSGPWPTPSGA